MPSISCSTRSWLYPPGLSAGDVKTIDRRCWRRLSIALVGGCLLAVALSACGVLFDKGPPPPTRRVRRDLLREIEELKQQLAEAKTTEAPVTRKGGTAPERVPPPVEKFETWKEAAELLPKDTAGHIDWVQALQAGVIAPRPGLDPRAPERVVLDLDVELAFSQSKIFTVTFPHGAHTQLLACRSCHSKIFPLRRGAEPTVVTMDQIKAGRNCGACHGPVSFGVKDECARCHTRVPAKAKWRPSGEPKKPIERARTWDEAAKLLPVTEGTMDWAKALTDGVIAPRPGIDPNAEEEPIFPSDVDLATGDESPGKVVFSHESHTTLLACVSCHLELEKSDTKTVYVGRHEDCKVCHGKVAFVMKKCSRCHVETEEGK